MNAVCGTPYRQVGLNHSRMRWCRSTSTFIGLFPLLDQLVGRTNHFDFVRRIDKNWLIISFRLYGSNLSSHFDDHVLAGDEEEGEEFNNHTRDRILSNIIQTNQMTNIECERRKTTNCVCPHYIYFFLALLNYLQINQLMTPLLRVPFSISKAIGGNSAFACWSDGDRVGTQSEEGKENGRKWPDWAQWVHGFLFSIQWFNHNS